ncbi:MAG: DNA/RNA non-specific endonuclease, partial [bacterium]
MTSEQKPKVLIGIVLALVIVGVIALAVLLLPSCRSPKPPVQPPPPVTQTTSSTVAGKYYYAGMPRSTHAIRVLTNIAYVTGYDETRHDPVWTCFRLFKVDNLKPPKRIGSFKVDSRTQSQISPKVYAHSGYQLGHSAPDKAIVLCYGAAAVAETYWMSNVLPETPELNAHVWMMLEKKEIEQYSQRFEETWTITGPIFDENPKTLAGGVQIPRALYRIIIDEERGKPRVLAFVIPQQ